MWNLIYLFTSLKSYQNRFHNLIHCAVLPFDSRINRQQAAQWYNGHIVKAGGQMPQKIRKVKVKVLYDQTL